MSHDAQHEDPLPIEMNRRDDPIVVPRDGAVQHSPIADVVEPGGRAFWRFEESISSVNFAAVRPIIAHSQLRKLILMKIVTVLMLMFICAVSTAETALPEELENPLFVGVGKVLITPQSSMWMAGYASRKSASEGTLQDIWAKALVIKDKTGTMIVIVTTDLLGLPASLAQTIANKADEKYGISRERLMLTSSHTHCGPVLRKNLEDMYDLGPEQRVLMDDYSNSLPDLILKAIDQAVAMTSDPCTVEWGIGSAGFAINRRQYATGGVNIGVNPIGPVDHDVPVLKVTRADGSVKAILFGYACHNTTLDIMQFNGDYAGFAQSDLEAKYPGATALFIAGCGGDQNPHPRREIGLAKQHGTSLAEAVARITESPMQAVSGPIIAAYREVPLALAPPPTREQIEKDLQSDNVYVQRRAKSLLRTLDEKGALETTYPYPVQTIQFSDDMTMIALGGEVVVDYSLRLKYELGRERLWVAAYANDVMAYIPSLRVLREGGYEGGDSAVYYGLNGPWAPEVEETIMGAVHAMLGR